MLHGEAMRRLLALCAAGAFAVGCADEGDEPPTVRDGGVDVVVRDGGPVQRDGGTVQRDGGARDAGVDAGFETLPLGPDDVIAIGDAQQVEIFTVGFANETSADLFIERYDEPFTTGVLQHLRTDAQTFGAPEPAVLGAAALTGSPSAVTLDQTRWLYVMHAPSVRGAASFVRHEWDGAAFGTTQSIGPIPSMSTILSWPQAIAMADGRVAVAYRTDQGLPNVTFSSDGLSFGTPIQVHTESAAIPTIAQLGDGTLVFTHQRPVGGEPMVSFWQLSSDGGQTWTPPARVTDAANNVHDTTVVSRRDGAADLYYIYPTGQTGFTLFRRSLDGAGTLGAEQQVTSEDVREPSKPRGLRLADGTLLVTYAEISERSAQGLPTVQRTKALLLRTDAPR